MSMSAGSTVARHGLGAIGAFAFLALWELAARWVWRDVQVLPAPTQAKRAGRPCGHQPDACRSGLHHGCRSGYHVGRGG